MTHHQRQELTRFRAGEAPTGEGGPDLLRDRPTPAVSKPSQRGCGTGNGNGLAGAECMDLETPHEDRGTLDGKEFRCAFGLAALGHGHAKVGKVGANVV